MDWLQPAAGIGQNVRLRDLRPYNYLVNWVPMAKAASDCRPAQGGSHEELEQTSRSRRSSSLALNPYFLGDTALTALELEQEHRHQIRFVEPR